MVDLILRSSIQDFQKKVINWEKESGISYPWRTTPNHWHALVAEIMLQRTRAEQMLTPYIEFTERFDTPEAFLQGSTDNIFDSLGLKWREQTLRELANSLAGRNIPDTRPELLKLPGVGDYVASAYLSAHVKKREFIIDSNVVRLYGRYWGFETNPETRRKKWLSELASELTPQKEFVEYNYVLIDFTKAVCKIRPKHHQCPVKNNCNFAQRLS